MIVIFTATDGISVALEDLALILRRNEWEYCLAYTPRQIRILGDRCDVEAVLLAPGDGAAAHDLLAALRSGLGTRAPNVIALCRDPGESALGESLCILPLLPLYRTFLDTVDRARRDWRQRNRCRQLEREAQDCREQMEQVRLCAQLQGALLSSHPLQLGRNCVLAATAVDRTAMEDVGFAPYEIADAVYAVRNILRYTAISPAVYAVDNLLAPHHLLLLFHGSSNEIQPEQVSRALRRIHDTVRQATGLRLRSGVSDCHSQVSNTPYRQAYAALTPHLLHPPFGVFFYSQLRPAPSISTADKQVLSHLVQQQDAARLRKLVLRLLGCAKPSELLSAWAAVSDLVFSQLIRCHGYRVGELPDRLLSPAEHHPELLGIEPLADLVADAVTGTWSESWKDESARQNTAQRVKAYIDQNYSRELTVRMLAERFHLNYSYLSDLFHREIGKGINAYIVQVRIEAAKKMLLDTDAGIHSVAEQAGYRDIHYFHRVFKKQTGLTPMAYRQNTKNIQL